MKFFSVLVPLSYFSGDEFLSFHYQKFLKSFLGSFTGLTLFLY